MPDLPADPADAPDVPTPPPGWRHRRLDDDTVVFLREGTRSRRVHRVGPRSNRTNVLYDPELAEQRNGRFERFMSGFLRDLHAHWLLAETRADVVLDVGANAGQYALALRQHGYRGRIVSFEPLPEYAARLRELAADDPDWQVHECALGNEDGTAEINLTPGTMSSLLPASDFGRTWSDNLVDMPTAQITIRRLADLWGDVLDGLTDARPFLKMDTQGYDLEAFRGAGEHVSELVGLQSEVAMVPIYEGMPRLPEQLAVYEAAGFETTGVFPVNRDRPTLRVIEMDLLMAGPRVLAERGVSGPPGSAARA